jgi:hypothetical protein
MSSYIGLSFAIFQLSNKPDCDASGSCRCGVAIIFPICSGGYYTMDIFFHGMMPLHTVTSNSILKTYNKYFKKHRVGEGQDVNLVGHSG